jgi:hypothetical protein
VKALADRKEPRGQFHRTALGGVTCLKQANYTCRGENGGSGLVSAVDWRPKSNGPGLGAVPLAKPRGEAIGLARLSNESSEEQPKRSQSRSRRHCSISRPQVNCCE